MDAANANYKEDDNITVKLSKAQQSEFDKLLKQGIFKELHQQGMLTDIQLSRLLHPGQYLW